MKKLAALLLSIILIIGTLPISVQGNTSVSTYAALEAAIAAAPTNGTATTITLLNDITTTAGQGTLTIANGQNIILTSVTGSTFTFTQTNAANRHFVVDGTMTLENITLSGPGGTTLGGGVQVVGGLLTMEAGSTITNARTAASGNAILGGAVYATYGGTFIMNGGTITGNSALWAGGGVLVDQGSVFTMNGGIISQNTAVSFGGGVYIENSTFTMNGGVISQNVVTSATGNGGGVDLKVSSFTINSGLITQNRAADGGGIYVDTASNLTIAAGTVSSNIATGDGGGIYTANYAHSNPLHNNDYSNLTIASGVIFAGNIAGNGAQVPPTNVTAVTAIAATSSSIYNNPVNNFDINFNLGTMVTTLTVTFLPGANGAFPGGTQSTENIPVTNSPRVPTSVPTVLPSGGYGFLGWTADGGVTVLTAAQVLATPINNSVTYVAVYQPPIAITFNGNGGAPATQTASPVQVGGVYAAPFSQISSPAWYGYVFLGWFTAPTGGTQVLPTATVTGGANQTLYAQWAPDPTVNITFDAQGGAPGTQVFTGRLVGDTYAATLASVAAPTRTGYAFLGWFDAAAGGNAITAASVIPGVNTTVYAQWLANPTFYVTFNGNGGTPASQTETVTTGSTYAAALSAVQPPGLLGYAFAGWFTAPAGGIQIINTTVVTATSAQVLYAQWTPVTVTITFNGNSGAPATQEVPGLTPGNSYAPVLASVTVPSLYGYTFTGWFTASTGGIQVSATDTIPGVDTTLYAQWTPTPPITITFSAQGGTPDGQTAPAVPGTAYAATLAAVTPPAYPGYIFTGWYTAAAGGTQVLPTTPVTATTNQTLFAQWITDPTVTISFMANGGATATPTEQDVPGNAPGTSYASVLASIIEPTQAGSAFLGWFTAPTGGVQITAGSTIATTDTTLYAQWTPSTEITIYFDGQSGTFDPAYIIPGDGATLISPGLVAYNPATIGDTFMQAMAATPNPAYPGYNFTGWWTTANGDTSGVQVFPTSTVGAQPGYVSPSDITLYAHWTSANTVDLSFNGNGGVPFNQVYYGATPGNEYLVQDFNLLTPTQPGYTFLGWFDAPVGGNALGETIIVPGADTTYYAQWAQNPTFTVTFDATGGTPDGQIQTVTNGSTYANALSNVQQPTQLGYAFTGWFTAATGGVQIIPTTVVTATSNQILYAQWEAVTVTISFDAQGGAPLLQVAPGQVPFAPATALIASITPPTNQGFVFAGWYEAPGGGSSFNEYSLIPPMSMTMYAMWTPAPTITVTFDAQGGSPSGETQDVTYGDSYEAALAAVPDPSQPGYIFTGWYTEAARGGTQILDTTIVTSTTNQILYAGWIPDPTVTISFNAQGGLPDPQAVPGNIPGTSDAGILNPLVTPVRVNYVFTGWFDAPVGGNQITDATLVPSANATFYAQWVPVPTFTITFDGQGGAPATQSASGTTGNPYGSVLSAVVNPALAGSVFQGWFTTPNGNNSGTQILPSTPITATANQTLYAHWVPLTITVTFDGQGGTPATQVVSGYVAGTPYQAALAAVATPTRTGYTFEGWEDAAGNLVTDTTISPATDQTLYAAWTQDPPITITFNALGATPEPGGTPAIQTATATPGNTFGAPFSQVVTPTMAGYAFVGWFTQIIGGAQVTASNVVTQTADFTLYAQWTLLAAQTVTVTFSGNGGTPPTQTAAATVGDSYGTALAALTAPTRPGYTFVGWFTAATGGTQVTAATTVTQTVNHTLYAQWALIAPIPPAAPPTVAPPDMVPPHPTLPHIPWQPRPGHTVEAATDNVTDDTTNGATDDTTDHPTDQNPPALGIPAPPQAVVNRLIFTVGSIEYRLNGAVYEGVGVPFIDPATNRMMVPLRSLAEAVGDGVAWDGGNQAAIIYLNNGSTLTLPIGEALPHDMGIPMMVNERVFVPLRFAMDALGKTVTWDGVNRAGVITW